jgi:transaldolase
MKIFLDTANIGQIREVHAVGDPRGGHHQPELDRQTRRGLHPARSTSICELVQGPVSAEVIAQDAEGMDPRRTQAAREVHEHVVVKVPLTTRGLSGTSAPHRGGIKVNVTLCFNGCPRRSSRPEGGRLLRLAVRGSPRRRLGWNGTALIEQIVKAFDERAGDIDTQVLAASIRHPLHLADCARAGADVITAPYNVLVQASVKHPQTDLGNKPSSSPTGRR